MSLKHQNQPFRIFKNCFFPILAAVALFLALLSSSLPASPFQPEPPRSVSDPVSNQNPDSSKQKNFIQWVDFDVTAEAMNQALHYDITSYLSPCHWDWISLLAFLGARYGGDFSQYQKADLEQLIQKLQNGSYGGSDKGYEILSLLSGSLHSRFRRACGGISNSGTGETR